MQFCRCESLRCDSFDALVEVAVQEDVIVDAKTCIKLVEQMHGEFMQVMPSFHEEDAVKQVKVLL